MLLDDRSVQGQLCGGDWRGPRIDWRDLAEHAEGVIILAGGAPGLGLLVSSVERAESLDEPAEALLVARRLAEIYDDRLYLTLAFHGSPGLLAVAQRLELIVWKAVRAESDASPGGGFRVDITSRGDVAYGTYLQIDPPRRIIFSWPWENADPAEDQSSSTPCLRLMAALSGRS